MSFRQQKSGSNRDHTVTRDLPSGTLTDSRVQNPLLARRKFQNPRLYIFTTSSLKKQSIRKSDRVSQASKGFKDGRVFRTGISVLYT
ncbi:hypothetical protein BPAE_0069g00340 [Botrytis paeoniae]|uniref:Uncharacterized protein n=1 Tax=Botrytis paeoniae TaxID=278948 RepID=A0A4Z1FSQ3_9HELO|nr:hypothetical protein BPAE_0069g00340 [Botrytis paeoniae]